MSNDSFNAPAAAADASGGGRHGGQDRKAGKPKGGAKQAAVQAVPRVPWPVWLGLLFIAAVYYLSQRTAGLLLSIYPFLHHWSYERALEWVNGSIRAQFFFVLCAEAFAVGLIYLFLRFFKTRFSLIGLKWPRWRDPFYGLLAFPVYLILYGLIIAAVTRFFPGFDVHQQQQLGFTDVNGTLEMTLTFLSLVILPPIAEEIMMRGFLYSTLKKAMPAVGAVLTTSGVFAVLHLPEGGSSGPLYIAALDTFVLSLVLIYLREKTGSLWASITLHGAKNALAFLYLFVLHTR